jgi:hypothetical protein
VFFVAVIVKFRHRKTSNFPSQEKAEIPTHLRNYRSF